MAEQDGTFDEFVAASAARLGRTAALLTGDRHLAEDLVQTALAKTYLRWHRLREPAAAEAYVRRVMVTTLIRWRRRRWLGEVPSAELPERAREHDPYGAADTRDVLRTALLGLPPQQRAVRCCGSSRTCRRTRRRGSSAAPAGR